MAKNIIKELFTDGKHQLGWILTTTALSVALHLKGIWVDWQLVLLLYLIVMPIDILKHMLKLQ